VKVHSRFIELFYIDLQNLDKKLNNMQKLEFLPQRKNEQYQVEPRKKHKPALKGPKEDPKPRKIAAEDHIGQLQQNAVDENLDREMEVVNNLLSEGKLHPHNVADPRDITMLDKQQSGANQRVSRDMFSESNHPSNLLSKFELNEDKIPDIYNAQNVDL